MRFFASLKSGDGSARLSHLCPCQSRITPMCASDHPTRDPSPFLHGPITFTALAQGGHHSLPGQIKRRRVRAAVGASLAAFAGRVRVVNVRDHVVTAADILSDPESYDGLIMMQDGAEGRICHTPQTNDVWFHRRFVERTHGGGETERSHAASALKLLGPKCSPNYSGAPRPLWTVTSRPLPRIDSYQAASLIL